MTDTRASSALERAARAAWEARMRRARFSIPRLGISEIAVWEELSPDFRAAEIAAMRAALEALREPTQAMIEATKEPLAPVIAGMIAADDAGHIWTDKPDVCIMAEAFRAMIDALLTEGQKEPG